MGDMIMKKFLMAAAAGAVLASPALAYERHGWYVGLEAGYSMVDAHTSFDPVGAGGSPFDFDPSYGVLGTVGGMLSPSWRLEGEIGYRRNTFTDNSGAILGGTRGQLHEVTFMVNTAWDHQVNDRWRVSVGGGVGMDYAQLDYSTNFNDYDYVFAYQGLAQLVYQASEKSDVFISYRYLGADGIEMDNIVIPGNQQRLVPLEMDLQKHLITIGFRYGYTAPEAPVVVPPPAEPPPAPKTFIIFFGFNKCNITAEADAVLSEAAAAAKSSGSASVKIVGHTDTVGSPAYNQRLSECRANAAKANLVGKGVSDGAISTSGKGESELMVQTGDSVKEPQNRRATVDLQ